MAFSNLHSLQTTLQSLKEIVDKNQGSDHEAAQLVRSMESVVASMESKASRINRTSDPMPLPPQVAPLPLTT